jgi:uncharacterized RDD family membrane protein YckC
MSETKPDTEAQAGSNGAQPGQERNTVAQNGATDLAAAGEGEPNGQRSASIPGRLIETGARGAKALAGVTGLDRAAEAATEDAIVAALESPALDRAIERFIEGDAFDRAVNRALQSPALEQAIVRALESPMSDRIWERLLNGNKAQALIERVAEAPEVRQAVAAQGVGLIEDIGRQLRRISDHLDDLAEALARKLLRRGKREEPTDRAGLVTRGFGLVIDAVILNAAFVLTTALVVVVINSVFAGENAGAPGLVIGTAAWIFALCSYLFIFWTLAGQTPGMRFLGIRLVRAGADQSQEWQLSARSAGRRLGGIALSILTLGIGFIVVLTGKERRTLADHIAGTDMVREEGRD